MLGTALWLVVAIGVLAAALMHGAATFGRAGVQAAADHAVEPAMHDAVADYQNRLQSAIAQSAAPLAPAGPFAGTTPSLAGYANALAALPNPLERTFPAGEQTPFGPRFTLAYAVTPTTLAPPSCPQFGAPASDGPDAIAWLQCSGFVQESRMSLHVVVRVLDAAGTQTLARRDQYVTLRLFAEPPYSAVAGRSDGTADAAPNAGALAPPPHEGDSAGDTISGASPPDAAYASSPPDANPWPAGGTLIHVRYECHDGAGRCANAAPPDPDGDLRSNTRWANGNKPSL